MTSSKKLMYFVAVAEESHFGRAAARLGISQPPLSEQIRQLEEDLGVQLFIRTTRSVKLTKQGEALLDHARKIISDIDKCQSIVLVDTVKARKSINLGVLHAHTYSFLPDFLRSYFKAEPDASVLLSEYTTKEQITRLLDTTISIGIVREPVVHPNIVVEHLFQEDYILAVPQDWLKEGVTHSSIKNFSQKTMISYPSHDSVKSTNRLFRDYFNQHGVQIADRIEVQTMHSALALVSAGKGFSPVPRSISTLRFPYIKYLEIEEKPPTLSVALAWREHYLEKHIEDFIGFSKRFFSART